MFRSQPELPDICLTFPATFLLHALKGITNAQAAARVPRAP